MKLIVQMPALNEAVTITEVISSIPQKIEGFDSIEILVVNDGSTDETASLAGKAGATVISHEQREGVGKAFQTGIAQSLEMGADIIVNPMKNLGVRVNLAEVVFGDATAFSLNAGNLFTFSTFDVLYYTNIAGLFSYVDIIFGLVSATGGTSIAVGGGLGLEKYMGKGNYIFLEPALIFSDSPFTDGDLTFRTSFGLKLGI